MPKRSPIPPLPKLEKVYPCFVSESVAKTMAELLEKHGFNKPDKGK